MVLLVFGYQLQVFSNKRGFQWFNKFKPLLDAYYAPYKKNTRYWTGLLLIVRACLYISNTITKTNQSSTILIVELSLFIALAIIPWLGTRIYENTWMDILEASFILNIIILALATYHDKGNQLVLSLSSLLVQHLLSSLEYLFIMCFFINMEKPM